MSSGCLGIRKVEGGEGNLLTFLETYSSQGPSINNVRTEGVWRKRVNGTDRLRDWESDEGEGVKNPKISRSSFLDGPLT